MLAGCRMCLASHGSHVGYVDAQFHEVLFPSIAIIIQLFNLSGEQVSRSTVHVSHPRLLLVEVIESVGCAIEGIHLWCSPSDTTCHMASCMYDLQEASSTFSATKKTTHS